MAPSPVGLQSWLSLHGKFAIDITRSVQLTEIRSWQSSLWFCGCMYIPLKSDLCTGAVHTPKDYTEWQDTNTWSNLRYLTCSQQSEPEGRETSCCGGCTILLHHLCKSVCEDAGTPCPTLGCPLQFCVRSRPVSVRVSVLKPCHPFLKITFSWV